VYHVEHLLQAAGPSLSLFTPRESSEDDAQENAEATGILDMAKELERLTKDTPAWYAGTRARVEARAVLEQAEDLRVSLE
jgi:hypothetical protein